MMQPEFSGRRAFAYGAAIILMAAFVFLASKAIGPVPAPALDRGPSAVLVLRDGGKGSGVHIGGGFIVSAAHVVAGASDVTVKTPFAGEQAAEVLWVNETYDVALLRIQRFSRIGASALACREPAQGEIITARGNPLGMADLISWGHVAGSAREIGHWRSGVIADLTIAPGNSGGPVHDSQGRLVGIAVGAPLVPMTFGASLSGFSIIVPGTVICELMGRA